MKMIFYENLIYFSSGQTENYSYGELFRGEGQITPFELDQVIIDTGTGDDEGCWRRLVRHVASEERRRK